ncbi:MAG: hypothetical protein AB4368_30915 [Xenococcaceae cyanobacterium]
MKTPVSLWILVARTDVPYMLQTIPHQIRACNYPFTEKVLAVDSAPLTGDKRYRYDTGSQEQLESACQTLVERGVIDKIVKIDYNPDLIKQIYTKYFGREQALQMLDHTHNWKGSTVYASLYCIEAAATDYYLHFDADMLLHQDPNYDWISKAIDLTESVPNIAITRPRCGPPHPEGKAFHPNPFTEDERGFLAHKFFSMRAYLIHRDRFAQLSPIPLMWKHRPLFSRYLPEPLQTISAKLERRLRGQKGSVKGAIASFEPMTSKKLEMSDYIRADLTSTQAWTIHPAKHGADFIKALPDLINSIEQGKYPLAQAGHYDLILEEWIELIESSHD